ncbi:MAG: PD-(D/E)XK nuclease family protein [Acidimicrobiia bacterium]|nr:PD-(D/E)XK nuclease family protein [Acidimicrobiia bacterium]
MIEFPPVQAGDDIRVSASSFVAYSECPERAAAHYRGIYGPDSRASFSGGLAHRLFARHLVEGEIEPAQFEQICREEIGSSNLNYKMAALGLKPSSLGRVIEEVGLLYERFKRLPSEGFEAAEVSFEVVPTPGVTLVGRVDAVFGGAEGSKLIDWKTGALGEVVLQLGFYAMLWALERGEPPGAVEAVSVATGERFMEVPSRGDIEETADRVAAMIDEMRAAWETGADLERRGGPWCRFCPVLEGCEEGSAAVRVAG